MTFIIGLTGSIGMGKSATAAMFRAAGVPVHDADAVVHALYRGAAVDPVALAFPGTVRDGQIDREVLGSQVLGNAVAIRRLEAIVHPLVRAAARNFVARVSAARVPCAVLDIPLLFEARGEDGCDAILVVSAPASVQKRRVLARPGMTAERFETILARQMPDSDKRRRAHLVIDTGRGFDFARRQVADALRSFAGRPGRAALAIIGADATHD